MRLKVKGCLAVLRLPAAAARVPHHMSPVYGLLGAKHLKYRITWTIILPVRASAKLTKQLAEVLLSSGEGTKMTQKEAWCHCPQ